MFQKPAGTGRTIVNTKALPTLHGPRRSAYDQPAAKSNLSTLRGCARGGAWPLGTKTYTFCQQEPQQSDSFIHSDETLISAFDSAIISSSAHDDVDDSWDWTEANVLKYLREGTPQGPSSQSVLVDKLGPAFNAVARPLSEENVAALVPAVNSAKDAFVGAQAANTRFTAAMLGANDVCQTFERQSAQLEEQLRKIIDEHQERKTALLERLKREIAVRDTMIDEYEQKVEHMITTALEELQDYPEDVEARLQRWEKKYQETQKTKQGKTSAENMLKELLSRM